MKKGLDMDVQKLERQNVQVMVNVHEWERVFLVAVKEKQNELVNMVHE